LPGCSAFSLPEIESGELTGGSGCSDDESKNNTTPGVFLTQIVSLLPLFPAISLGSETILNLAISDFREMVVHLTVCFNSLQVVGWWGIL